MTTFYPSQPTPQFLKRYSRNVYNRVHNNAHFDNGHASNEDAALALQPYRSTPLVLPGAKVYHNKNLPTESYLRHHPNPQMRGGPTHEYIDSMMKQKVADSVIQRVVGHDDASYQQQQHQYQQQQAQYQQQQQAAYQQQQQAAFQQQQQQQQQAAYQQQQQQAAYQQQQAAYQQQPISNGPKLVHKQFNSPIGLYSDSNIENTIKQTVAPISPNVSVGSSVPSPNGTLNRQQLPTKIQGYKKTVVFDPLKSETYRALQESSYSNEKVHEVATPAQTRVFMPNRLVPGKKPPVSSFPPPDPQSRLPVNTMGDSSEVIHQSNSFYRLMHSVLGETDY